MLSKIAAAAHSKVALAVLGVVLVGGSGGAVAMAASTGHLSTLGVNVNTTNGGSSSDSHDHTMGVEGLLTACSATTTPATISVKDSAGKSWTFAVSATTKFNGDAHSTPGAGASSAKGDNSAETDDHSTSGTGTSSAKGDSSTHAGDSSTRGDTSAKGGSSSETGDHSTTGTGTSSTKGDSSAESDENSAHAVTLAQVCASANIGTRHVQVQATKNGASYDAWKVTMQGPGSANGGSSDGHSSTSGDSSSDGHSSTSGDSSSDGSHTGTTSASSH